jgi:hypothetical protein
MKQVQFDVRREGKLIARTLLWGEALRATRNGGDGTELIVRDRASGDEVYRMNAAMADREYDDMGR